MESRERLEQIERVAEAIYRHQTCAPEEYERVVGAKMRAWGTWNDSPDELAEWERDDYRRMARAAIEALSPKRTSTPEKG